MIFTVELWTRLGESMLPARQQQSILAPLVLRVYPLILPCPIYTFLINHWKTLQFYLEIAAGKAPSHSPLSLSFRLARLYRALCYRQHLATAGTCRGVTLQSTGIIAASPDKFKNKSLRFSNDKSKNGQKDPVLAILGYQKWHFGCPNQKSKTTFQHKLAPKTPQKTPQ